MSQERDIHFANFAEMEFRDLTPHLANYLHALNEDNVLEMHRHEKTIKRILAQRGYDLMYYACCMINNAQFKSGGIPLHPNAMMRAIEDLTELPE